VKVYRKPNSSAFVHLFFHVCNCIQSFKPIQLKLLIYRHLTHLKNKTFYKGERKMPKYARTTAYTGRKGTENKSGQLRLATAAEGAAGVRTDVAISPAILDSAVESLIQDGTTTQKGIVRLATVGETTAGVLDTVANTPAGLAAVAIAGSPDASETVKGIAEIATTAEAVAVTDDERIITASKVGDIFAAPPAIGSGTPADGSFAALDATGVISGASGAIIASGGAGDIDLGADAQTDAINVGTGAAARTITVGNITTTTAVAINSGTGHITLTSTSTGDINLVAGDKVLIDAAGTVELESSAGAISIGADDIDQDINIGTDGERTLTMGSANGAAGVVIDGGTGDITIGANAIAHSQTLGNVTGASALVLLTGTGNFSLDGVGATTYEVGPSTTSGTIVIGGTSQTGTLTLGDSDGTNIVEIGSGEGATTVAIAGGATSAKTVTIADGAVANLVTIGSVSGAASLDLLVGTGNFTLEGATTSTYELSSTGVNTGTVKLASGTGARTVEIAGGGTGVKTVNIAAAASADVITIGDATGAGSLALVAGTGGATLDSGDAISVDSVAASNFTVTGAAADLTLASVGGSVNIDGSEADGAAISIQASDAAGGIDCDSGTAGTILDSTGAISLDAAAASNFTVTGAGIDLTLDSAAGRVIVNGEEAAANAITLLSAAGGIDADAALEINIASSQAAATAISLTASDGAGGVTATVGTGDFNISGGDLKLATVATQIHMNGGAATDFIGLATFIAGEVVVANTNIKATDRISCTRSALNGSPAVGFIVYTIAAGATITFNAINVTGGAANTDVTSFSYVIVNQT
jgi:hypothetical protein